MCRSCHAPVPYRQVQLVYQGKPRKGKAHTGRLFKGNAHILDKVIDEESGIEISPQDTWREIVQCPAPCCTALDGIQHRRQIKAGFEAVYQAFTHSDHGSGDDDLVAHFGMLTRTRRSLIDDVLSHYFQDG